jgi:glutathione S-transferase
VGRVYGLLGGKATVDDDGNPPIFAPPALRVPGAGRDGQALVISQTANVLLYLGERWGMMGQQEGEGEGADAAGFEGAKYWVNELVMTALDLCNETHDTHHPVASAKYYEDQKDEALKKATDFREARVPKFLGYFERVLKGNEELGKGRYLVGAKLSVADTALWQSLDG